MVLREARLLLCLVCIHAVPISDPDWKPTLDSRVQAFQGIQTNSQAWRGDDEDAFVGGMGIVEPPVVLPEKSKPMASLLQVEEGAPEQDTEHCSKCLLDKIQVPEDFAGDLNELAEQAYAPDPVALERLLHPPHQATADDEDLSQWKPPAMKPGDELIGGYGIDESKDENAQMNLEIGEGFDESISQVPHEVARKSQLLQQDMATKAREIDSLKQTLAKLRSESKHMDDMLQDFENSSQTEVEKVKQEEELKLKEEEEDYEAQIKKIEQSSEQRVSHLRVEEDHLRARRVSADELALLKERETQEAALRQAQQELKEAEAKRAAAELRAQKAHPRDSEWNNEDAADEDTLRGRLGAIKHSVEEIRAHADEEDVTVRDLTNKMREDQHIKTLLDARLKNLHMREEAVKEKEKELEAANANLHHQLDEQEYNSEHAIEAIANARSIAASSKDAAIDQAEHEAAEKEKAFEETTLQAAKDEIARLKDELVAKERREAHAEQILLEQEKSIEFEDNQASEIDKKAKLELDTARAEIEDRISAAQKRADEIVAKAAAATKSIRERSKAEGMEDSQELIQQGQISLSETEKTLEREERQTKKLGSELRSKMEDELKKEDDMVQQQLKAKREQLELTMHKEAEASIAKLKVESASRIDDVSADWMAASIRSEKDRVELDEAKKANNLLQKEMTQVKKQLDQVESEWKFQQAIATQPPPFSHE